MDKQEKVVPSKLYKISKTVSLRTWKLCDHLPNDIVYKMCMYWGERNYNSTALKWNLNGSHSSEITQSMNVQEGVSHKWSWEEKEYCQSKAASRLKDVQGVEKVLSLKFHYAHRWEDLDSNQKLPFSNGKKGSLVRLEWKGTGRSTPSLIHSFYPLLSLPTEFQAQTIIFYFHTVFVYILISAENLFFGIFS